MSSTPSTPYAMEPYRIAQGDLRAPPHPFRSGPIRHHETWIANGHFPGKEPHSSGKTQGGPLFPRARNLELNFWRPGSNPKRNVGGEFYLVPRKKKKTLFGKPWPKRS